MKHKILIPILAVIIFLSFNTFSYALAIDNNCPLNVIHILQVTPALLCLEERIDTLENASPVSGGANALNDLTDVTITNPLNTQIITYDSGIAQWKNVNRTNTIEILCQNEITTNSTQIACNDFPVRKYTFFDIEYRTFNASMVIGWRYNGDSGTNYSVRGETNAVGFTVGSNTNCNIFNGASISSGNRAIIHAQINNNVATDEKVTMGMVSDHTTTGSAVTPNLGYFGCKWINTTNNITSIVLTRISGSGLFNTGSRIIVYSTNTLGEIASGLISGETNTASNVGSGIGLFKQKTGVDLEFKTLLGSSDISITSQSSTVTIDFNGTASAPLIGQQVGDVYFSLVKTNIGNTYIDIYTTAFDEEDMMIVDCTSVTDVRAVFLWDYVGTGTQQVRWVDVSNNANVFIESATFTADQDPNTGSWVTKPAWCTGVVTLEWQGKSTTAGDDPIAKGYKLFTR